LAHKNPLYELDWNFDFIFCGRKVAKIREKKKENLMPTINNDDIVSTN